MPTPPPSPKNTATSSDESINIIVTSEMPSGSTGIVHIGSMRLETSDPSIEVAVKLAFDKADKDILQKERDLYRTLHSESVTGIPQVIGLFESEDHGEPHALVMTYAGVSLKSGKDLSVDVKLVALSSCSHVLILTRNERESLLATLQSIHDAGVLHGDIRLPNLCVLSEKAYIIDFSHASISDDSDEARSEMLELRKILGHEPQQRSVKKSEQIQVRTK